MERTDYDPEKRKHSFHLKETKFSFPNMTDLKRFMEGSKADVALLQYLKNKGCDTDEKPLDCSIYREGGLRLLYSSKLGKNRPLHPYKFVDPERGLQSQMPGADCASLFDFWVASKITHVEGYEELQVPDRVRSVYVSLNESSPDQQLVVGLISLIAAERWEDYHFWIRMLLCLRALGDEYRSMFLRASSRAQNLTPRGTQGSGILRRPKATSASPHCTTMPDRTRLKRIESSSNRTATGMWSRLLTATVHTSPSPKSSFQ